MKTKIQTKGTHWARILIIVTVVSATLACSVIETPAPTTRPTSAPTRTPIPTWTPTPRPTTGEISGQVTDASSSSPIPNANVTTDPPTISVTADTQGRYVIPEVPPGVYTITAAKPGYTSASVQVSVTVGKTTTADVHLVASLASTETPPAIIIWQVGVDNQSDTEFGGSLGRDPLFYRVPPEWASMIECVDCWSEFPSQLNPPEDRPDMPRTVHMLYNYTASSSSLVLRVVVNGRDSLQGERLRVLFDEVMIDDVVVTSVSPAWDTFEFDLPTIIPGEHTVTLENSGGGGLTFDYVQVLTTDSDYSTPVPAPTPQASLADGLVAYYPFNGNADDESGHGNHGIVHGATLTTDRFGSPDQAYEFDGMNDYIQVPTNILYHNEFAQSLWIWISPSQPEASQKHILQTGNGGIYYLPVEKNFRVDIYHFRDGGLKGPGSATRYYYDFSADGLAGTWNHIVLIGFSDNTAKFFVNGAQIPTGERITDRGVTGDYNATVLGATMDTRTGDIDENFAGRIDDVRIYNRALSEAEIQALYEQDS